MVFVSKRWGIAFVSLLFTAGFLVLLRSDQYKSLISSTPSSVLGFVPISSTPPAYDMQTSSVHSPDGIRKIDMRRIAEGNGSVTYSFFTSDLNGANNHILYVSSPNTAESLSIPLNSWSPDDQYVFLKKSGPGAFTFMVLNQTGEPFSDGVKFIDVGALLIQKDLGVTLRDVTGWDGPGLLHVWTHGSSYWFDVESRSFIELATL